MFAGSHRGAEEIHGCPVDAVSGDGGGVKDQTQAVLLSCLKD